MDPTVLVSCRERGPGWQGGVPALTWSVFVRDDLDLVSVPFSFISIRRGSRTLSRKLHRTSRPMRSSLNPGVQTSKACEGQRLRGFKSHRYRHHLRKRWTPRSGGPASVGLGLSFGLISARCHRGPARSGRRPGWRCRAESLRSHAGTAQPFAVQPPHRTTLRNSENQQHGRRAACPAPCRRASRRPADCRSPEWFRTCCDTQRALTTDRAATIPGAHSLANVAGGEPVEPSDFPPPSRHRTT